MNEIEILDKVLAYESMHNVEDYVVDGWHVWPLLRTAISLHFLPSARPGLMFALLSSIRRCLESTPMIGKYILPLGRFLAYSKSGYKQRRSFEHRDDESKNNHLADVILLTLSERRVMVDGSFFEIYTDPLVDLLHELGLSSLVWEQGDGRYPQYSESVKILNKLNAEMIRLSHRRLKEPAWFADYRLLVGDVVGREVAWGEIAPMIESVTNRAIVFERWLRRANARVLFLVCWYDPLAMSATMAARRCGVKTVEIQHGVQGKGHFAYSSWLHAPFEGYEVVPDVFWCWGKASAKELQEYNQALFTRSSALAGGNLWLNRWRQSARKSFSVIKRAENDLGGVKRILVTLGHAVPKHLLEAISASPTSWVWMIRFHPSRAMEHRIADMGQFQETGHGGVEFERSNESLLYELLNDCDVHVTEISSCALEALAFGVPSVILGGTYFGETGKSVYRPFIEKELMFSADTASDLIAAIYSATLMDQTDSKISDIFADDNAAKASLSQLMRNSEEVEL